MWFRESGDENEERGNWGSKLDFLLSCLGYAVGLGNVWRFPFLAYDNGGGAFFIPYVIMLLLVGMPIFFLELSLGQFSSSGPATCWRFAPIFTGIGAGMVIVSALVCIYYNMIIGWGVYYLFASFTSDLPWETCKPEWASPTCRDFLPLMDKINCTDTYGWDASVDGACYNSTAGKMTALWNATLAKLEGIKRTLPTEDYLRNDVLGIGKPGAGLDNMGPVKWELVLCYLAGWIFVCLTLSKGVKSSGKVVYVTATFPYLVLIILLIRGVLLDGYYKGIDFYISPDLSILKNAKVWKEAANQIFFSLSASWGGLIALSSYNKFHNDVFRDAVLVSVGNCLTSVFAGFVIFSYLGFLATELNEPVGDVASGGTTLAFVVYPFAVTKMPVSTLWAILFFIMLITLGVDSQFVLVETVTTSFMDVFPKTRKFKFCVVMGFCFVFFLLGLTLTTEGGLDMLDLMDAYAGGWNVLIIAICECIAIAWVYGVKRFLMDIETMIGVKVCGCLPWIVFKYWWALCWTFVTPALVVFVTLFSWVDYQRVDKLPKWADALGWLMTLSVIFAIIITAIVKIVMAPGSFREKIRAVVNPTRDWGPALPKHRALVTKYVPDLVVDPHEDTDGNASPNSYQIPSYIDTTGIDNMGYESHKL
ncbi:sodium- and chloride-dependent neutral and basic amino acid transporter B(0+)-like isoform X2 [Babylonia areolata]|uniref:sodium- and chloride-dependent neutral and basic amino acid transporter B(0+)-like isoform X2 n=1 Tax=Babylonia areolata TaxID=304850 RepID=UPI003FD1322A